jgi:hypothetical protein
MARKTYKPGVYFVLRAAQHYITRWLPFMEAGLSEQQLTCLNACLTAITECLPLFLPPPPTP